jgi:putative ABC transport system ATP-binding protein
LNAIEIKNVEFSYSTTPNKPILQIAHWHVKQGEQLFIQGLSGSGKSTLLNLVCGLNLPNSGSVKVLGKSLVSMNSRQRDKFRSAHIGYIFQQFNLISYLSAIDNIKLASHFSTIKQSDTLLEEIHTLLTTLNLKSQDWQRPVEQLSVGQQQRVGIARALINKPQIIIADEPTSSLDEAARDSFVSLLSSLCKEYASTLLFVSHDSSLSSYFHSTIALADINKTEPVR